MLINKLFNNEDRPFESTIKKRIVISALFVVFGSMAFIIAILFREKIPSDFIAGIYTGTGAGLIGAGILRFVTNMRLLKNKEKMKIRETVEKDERNAFLMLKSSSTTLFIGVLGLYLAFLVVGMIDLTILFTLLACGAGFALIWVVTYLIYSRKY